MSLFLRHWLDDDDDYGSDFYSTSHQDHRPDPEKFSIKRTQQVGCSLVAEVHYTGCNDDDYKRCMVFERVRESDFKAWWTKINPFFSPCNNSPIAMFRADDFGWLLAIETAKLVSEKMRRYYESIGVVRRDG